MPIRSQVQSTPETVEGFEKAAEGMYEDGFNLMASASGNGVYLMGYVAEMLLKSAYFRFVGLSSTAAITKAELNQAHADAVALGVVAGHEQFHGLEFWAELLLKTRQQAASPLDGALEVGLGQHSRSLAQNWLVNMRYHSHQGIQAQDLEAVLDDVVWIKSNYEKLWR